MKKKLGIGSLALLLSIICIFLSLTFHHNGVCYGDQIINFLGLKAWSNGSSGTHYTIFYMLIFFAISIVLGYKYESNFGAKSGRVLSIVFSFIILFSIPLTAVSLSSYEAEKTIIINNQEFNETELIDKAYHYLTEEMKKDINNKYNATITYQDLKDSKIYAITNEGTSIIIENRKVIVIEFQKDVNYMPDNLIVMLDYETKEVIGIPLLD